MSLNGKIIDVAVGIILKGKSVLLCQRKKDARYPLKWEFPGGKLEFREMPEGCLHRELREELGIDARAESLFFTQTHEYPDSGTFRVFYFFVREFSGEIANHVFERCKWVPVSKLKNYDILEGNKEVVEKLLQEGANIFSPATEIGL